MLACAAPLDPSSWPETLNMLTPATPESIVSPNFLVALAVSIVKPLVELPIKIGLTAPVPPLLVAMVAVFPLKPTEVLVVRDLV